MPLLKARGLKHISIKQTIGDDVKSVYTDNQEKDKHNEKTASERMTASYIITVIILLRLAYIRLKPPG